MIEIGRFNRLRIVKELDFGLYLDGAERGEILLPRRYVPETFEIGEELDVFIYFDSEERIIATTLRPYAQVGEVAYLYAKMVNNVGAFLDWGLMKDIFVPFREQRTNMEEGRAYLVYIYVDEVSQRIVASAKLNKFLDNVRAEYTPNQEVDLIIGQESELGYKVVINHLHTGMIYHNQIFQPLERGEKLKGYIKQVREDDKIDVMLQPMGYEQIDGLSQEILDLLQSRHGYLPVTDKSSAEEIMTLFSCSKKSFKKAIGALYKRRIIAIEADGIRFIQGGGADR